MEHFNFNILIKILVGLLCSMFLFGSVVQTVSAENALVSFENRNQISFGNATRTNNVQREERNSNRNNKTDRMQERRNQAKSPTSQPGTNKTEINNENSNNYNITASGDVVIGTMNKDSHNDNSVNINNSKNDNRVYDKSINNSEIDNSKNKGATINSHNTKDSHNTTNSYNVNVTKNGSGQTNANSAGTVNVKKNSNTNRQADQNTARTQNASSGNNTGSKQYDSVKSNPATQQNTSVKNSTNLNTSTNVQVNTPHNNSNPRQQQNNKNFGNRGNVSNTNTAQKMQQKNRTTVNNKNTNNYNIKSEGDVVIGEMKKDSHDNNSINIDNSRNDNRVYDSSINNSKIDNSKNKGATINSHNTENSHNVTNSGNVNIEVKETIKENINHDPQGNLDSIQYKGVNQVYVKGWAYDEDNLNTAVNVEFRVGSENSDTKFTALANKLYSTQIGNHGFDGICSVDLSKYVGWQEVYAFAKNIGSAGTDKKIGSGRINIPLIVKGEATVNTFTDNNRKFEVKGWTNTTRVDVYVDGKKLYQINVNNPNNSQQNFAETYILPNEYKGQYLIVVEAVDATNVSNKKEIGRETINIIIKDWLYASLPDGWYKIVSAATSGVLFDVKNDSFVEGNKVYASGSYWKAFYLQNVGNNYFTLKADLSDCYLAIPVVNCAKLSKSNTSSISRWRLMYEKSQGTGSGYYLESQSAQNSEKRILGIVNGQDLGLKEPLDYDSYRWKFIPVNAPKPPKPDVDGSVSVIENPENNKVHIKGWANTSRVDVAVGNTSYQISLNNPNYERKEFDDVHTLSNNISGTQQVTVKAVDAADTSRNKNIGNGQVTEISFNPEGKVDYIVIKDFNNLIFNGSAVDKDDLNANIQINVYFDEELKYSIFTQNRKFNFDKKIDVREDTILKQKVRIEALNIGGGKNVDLYVGDGQFENPIRSISGIRLSNGSYGFPYKQLVYILKEDRVAGTYYIRYNDHNRENVQPDNGITREGWVNKGAFYEYTGWQGQIKSGEKRPVYLDEAMTNRGNTANIPEGQNKQPKENVWPNADVFVIYGNDQRTRYMIRYNSSVDNIWKDRWVSRDYFVSIPEGL